MLMKNRWSVRANGKQGRKLWFVDRYAGRYPRAHHRVGRVGQHGLGRPGDRIQPVYTVDGWREGKVR